MNPRIRVLSARSLFALCLACSLVDCGSSNSSSSVSAPPPPTPPQGSGSVVWKPGSTTPLAQMTGDVFQFLVNGTLNFYPTPSLTVTNSGAAGTDLGIPVSFPGKVILLWGDTTPVYSANIPNVGPGFYIAQGLGNDGIGMMPDVDLSPCSAIPNLYSQLLQSPGAKIDYSQCPDIAFFNQPSPPPRTAPYQPTTITGLGPNEATGLLEVPTGGFSLNNNLYMFYTVTVLSDLGFQYDPNNPPNFPITSILAKSQTTSGAWSTSAPPTFSKIYDASKIPAATITTAPYSLSNPPPEVSNPGKFIFVAPRLLQSSAISQLSWFSGLPAPIQASPSILFLFGASWHFGNSNMYLAVVSSQDIEATDGMGGPDTTKWWYYAGLDQNNNPVWSHSETSASPLISSWSFGGPSMDKHAVMWIPELHHFILHYQDHGHGLQSRSALAPWGSWTSETTIFSKDDPTWGVSISHHPGQDAITAFAVPPLQIYNQATGMPIHQDPNDAAFIYGGYFFDRYTVNSDNSITFYLMISTHVPYAVFLGKTTYCLDTTSSACSN